MRPTMLQDDATNIMRRKASLAGDRSVSTRAARVSRISECDRGTQPENRFVADDLAGVLRIPNAAAGIDHILEVWLKLPPRGDLILIGDFDEMLDAAHRKGCTGETGGVSVESAGISADMRPAVTDADRIVIASGQGRLQRESGVEAGVDQVAI